MHVIAQYDKAMKVLHAIPSLSPELGGPHLVAVNLVYALRQLGVEAEIVSTNHGLDVPTHQRVDHVFDRDKSVPVWFLPYDPPPLKEFIFSRAVTSWLWKNLANYDVVDNHYLFSYVPSCAAAIARFKDIPYTVRTMGQIAPWALSQSELKKRVYMSLVERRNLQKAAAIHCTTAAEAEDVRLFGLQTPTITLPLGVPIPTAISDAKAQLCQRYGIEKKCPIVLFLSRIHYKKQPDLLLRCLKRLKEQHRDCHLVIAGSGDVEYVEGLKALAKGLEIEEQVTFTGFVSGFEKDLLFQGSDLFALPSHSENFGIAVAEALAASLPVVITPGVQISPEIAQAKAGLVVNADVDAVTGAIGRLLDSVELRAGMGDRGAQLARTRYSWRSTAQQLAVAYGVISSQGALPLNVYKKMTESAFLER